MQITTLKQVKEKLRQVDVGSEPIVFLHSSLFQLGKLDFSLNDLVDLLINWIGPDGTLLMPSFSYQNVGQWHASQSRGKTGILTEYFRLLHGSVRSIHPIHSVTAFGKHAYFFTREVEKSSFGPNSVFKKLIDADAVNISIGANFEGGATYLHCAEELAAVPFREFTRLSVKCFDSKDLFVSTEFEYYARMITVDGEFVNEWTKPLSDFKREGLFIFDKIGSANFMHSRMRSSAQYLVDRLRLEPFYCARFRASKDGRTN